MSQLNMYVGGLTKTELIGDTDMKSSVSLSKKITKKDTTRLGNLVVPNVGIGTISWTSKSLTRLENDELQSLVDTAYQSNSAFFDTAERYGNNVKTAFGLGWGDTERLTRKILDETMTSIPPQQRKSLSPPIIATKFTPSPWRSTSQSVVDACIQSLSRLSVPQIDLYQLHMPDIVQPLRFASLSKSKDETYWDGLAECYHRGLIKNVGVCNYGPTLVARCQEALAKRGVPLASNQIAYSLIGRHDGAQETVDKCRELGVKVLAYYPFAMGLLTGKYADGTSSTEMTGRSSSSSLVISQKTKLETNDLKRYASDMSGLYTVLETIARKRKKSVAQVALNYIICKGAIPIPGSRTAEQVFDNIGAMGWRLSSYEIVMLELEADRLGYGFDGAGFKRTSEKFVGYGVERWRLD